MDATTLIALSAIFVYESVVLLFNGGISILLQSLPEVFAGMIDIIFR